MAEIPPELQFEIEKLERKHAEHPEGRFFVPLANAYRKMGDVETAEALLRAGVEKHPDYLSAHIVLGRCLADRGATTEAAEEFRFVLSEDPQNLIALRTLGELALANGSPGEAADWYRELLAVDPMNEDARQALDSLSDAPATTEVEAEFRAGAGWWDPAAAATEGAEPDRDAIPASDLGGFVPAPSGEGDAADQWGGYDDLPGLRAEPREGDEHQGEHAFGAEAVDYPEPPAFAQAPLDDEPLAEESVEIDMRSTTSYDDTTGSSEVVTETIAELYARQGLHERAVVVYRELIRRRGGDPALERRLEDLERQIRAEAEGGSDLPGAQVDAQDTAFDVEPVEVAADDDPFAASFAAGFGSGDDADDAAEDDADSPASEEAEPAERAAAEPSPAAAASPSSIVHFLSGLAAWRPSGAGAAAATVSAAVTTVEEEVEDELAADVEYEVGDEGEEGWAESAHDAGVRADESPLPTWEAAEGGYAPTEPEVDDGADLDSLPYLERVRDDEGGHGTGSAEEEPFPWELPAAPDAGIPDAERLEANAPLDSFGSGDASAEPAETVEALPEAAATAEPGAAAATDATEDEDLESFQAWLRSLKR